MHSKRLKKSYAIKPPRGRRRSFAIQEVDGFKRRTLEIPELDAVNKLLISGKLSLISAKKQVEDLRDSLYAKRDSEDPRLLFHSDNLQLLNRYWTEEYSDRDIVDLASMKADLRRAVESCGSLSMLTASKIDLGNQIAGYCEGNTKKQRRVISRINQLLKYVGRDFVLRKPKESRLDVAYLTDLEMLRVLAQCKDDNFGLLCQIAFWTGLRMGEIFALRPNNIRADYIIVESQIDDEGERRATKTRAVRRAWVASDKLELVREWVRLPEEIKIELRDVRHSTLFKRLCRKAYPKDKSKWVRFHDLRHSYAVGLINKGVPINLVAQSLGNSISVCEKYYSGFVLRDEGIDTINRILKS